MMRRVLLAMAAAAALSVGAGGTARADESLATTGPETEAKLPELHWSFDGIFGTFDRAAARRGFEVYSQVCSACHSMSLLAYRDLEALGYSADDAKQIASQVQVTDGPNDQGEMFERPGRPSDHFRAPSPNEKAARSANNGALPPDLSLIVKAREGGPDYVHALLNGYREPPANVKMQEGMNYNIYFPGHQIGMPPPLSEGAVTYADGTKATMEQMTRDVATFLTWASEPKLETRKRTGVKVMIFLCVLTGLLYATKRKIWAGVH